jgi:hypothetical protein
MLGTLHPTTAVAWLVAANINRPSRGIAPRSHEGHPSRKGLIGPDIILNLSQNMRYLVAMANVCSAAQPLRPGRPHRRVYQIVCLISIE